MIVVLLLFLVAQGIDGQSIKYDSFDALYNAGGAHALDPSLNLTTGKKDLILHIAELGWLFRKVASFAERATSSLEELGLVGQAFCFSLQVGGVDGWMDASTMIGLVGEYHTYIIDWRL